MSKNVKNVEMSLCTFKIAIPEEAAGAVPDIIAVFLLYKRDSA